MPSRSPSMWRSVARVRRAKTCSMRSRSPTAGRSSSSRGPWRRRRWTPGWDNAIFSSVSLQWPTSVASARMNFRRAGTFANSRRTSMRVPTGMPTGSSSGSRPGRDRSRVPADASRCRDAMLTCATAAIDASASPRNPSVATSSSSAPFDSLLVACRVIERTRSSGWIPTPSSSTTIFASPASSSSTSTRPRPGVDRILDQLLHNRRGTLHHLPRRDLIGELRPEHSDAPRHDKHLTTPQPDTATSAATPIRVSA